MGIAINKLKDGLILAVTIVVCHGLLYIGAKRLFQASQAYSPTANILVVGNSRIEQGIQKSRVKGALPGGVAFLASQGMDLKIAKPLVEAHLDANPGTHVVWLGVDPWQVSEQYGEMGFRNWLPMMDHPGVDAYLREAMRADRRDYLLMKTLPLLRFNGVKARLVRSAVGMGNVSVNRNVVTEAQIREVVTGYATKPLRTDPEKLADLDSICVLVGKRGVSLRLFFMPVLPELEKPWDIAGFRVRIADLSARHPGASFVDFNNQMRDHKFFRDTGHLNGLGARNFTGIFLDSLRKQSN